MEINTGTEHQGQVIAQYRKAKNWSQEDLAGALRVDTRTVQRMEQHPVIKNADRRRFLIGLLGIPAALLGLEEEQKASRLVSININSDRMAFFEEEMATRWEMYHTGGTLRASRGIEMWLSEIERFAKSAQQSIWRERATILLSMSYQLYSSVSRDMMNYQQAHKAFNKAYVIAKETGNAEVIASTLAREGVTFIQQDKAKIAIEYLNEALEVTANSRLPQLKGYILQALSEAYAKNQQSQQTWQCVKLAERILERQESAKETNQTKFNTASLTAQKGVNAVLLKDYDRAINLIDRGLTTYDPTIIRGRARLVAQKAEAYYGLRLIDASVTTAEEAYTLAKSVGSNKTIARISTLYDNLVNSSWGKEPGVARLGAILSIHS